METCLNRVHIFGAGLAGLAAAVYCQKKGFKITVYEAANHAGGRCRSFHDPFLDCVIDNGNHLILRGNTGIFDYLNTIGALTKLNAVNNAFPFIDLNDRQQWTLRPGNFKIPLWTLLPQRRIPGTKITDYFALKKITKAPSNSIITNHVNTNSVMFRRFWEPLSNAVLNTDVKEGSARLLGKTIELTLLRGRKFAQPFLASEGLSETLVDPAINYLVKSNCDVNFGSRIRSISVSNARVQNCIVGNLHITCRENDYIILALPPNEAASLLPELTVPTETRPIINIHFSAKPLHQLPNGVQFLGIVNGISQWIFQKNDLFSVTISNAGELVDINADELARKVWAEVTTILQINKAPIPPYRVLKERRATIAHTPQQDALRPDAKTKWKNLFLAGDWTNTGLPATIEGAIRSGQNAAETLEQSL